jgi:hypothetical protein
MILRENEEDEEKLIEEFIFVMKKKNDVGGQRDVAIVD